MFPKFRKSAVIVLTSALAVSTILSASAASTTKNLSSNFTLVNLTTGENTGQIRYVQEDGSDWRDAPDENDNFTLNGLGDQLERRQYFDENLPPGSGSVVVSTDGPVGAVVQIQARAPQVSTNGAYIGVSEGAEEANVPLVMRRRGTASGLANSQIIIQNASGNSIDVEVQFFDGISGDLLPGATRLFPGLAANAAVEYDLDTEGNLPEGWYGSAVIRSTTASGAVAVVSNLFSGDHAMQTFNGFISFETEWGIPLLASRLANGLSTPLVIQNKSGAEIPPEGITLSCIRGNGSPEPDNFTLENQTAIPHNSAFFDFNPVTNMDFPNEWFGACNIDSDGAETALFIQMRVVGKEDSEGNHRAGAYEGIPMDGTDRVVSIPLYARRLVNGFVSNATILNLSTTAPANVTLEYQGAEGYPAGCSASFSRTIPPGGSLLQNHRIPDAVPNSVPEVDENCYGTLTVTSSDQPINAFVQFDQLDDLAPPPAGQASGDRFMAHAVFTLPGN